MSSSFSLAAKVCIGASNGKFMYRKSTINNTTKAEVTIADHSKQRKARIFPELSKKGIPHDDLGVREIVERQSKANNYLAIESGCRKPLFHPVFLEEAYEQCRNICAEYAKSYYLVAKFCDWQWLPNLFKPISHHAFACSESWKLKIDVLIGCLETGSLLLTEERQKAIWAIYVWCRRTDELVDGPNSLYMSSAVLDTWEERLQDIFNGRPYDKLDAALTDTVYKFPLDIKPFKDMIEGMRMDTRKSRYENFQELYLYCYYVGGTAGLMSVPVMGITPESSLSVQTIYDAALYLGIGNQLTNILRDVGEDALRGRVYLPQDELAQFGLGDENVFSRKVTDKWREFMKEQIRRARFYYNQAEEGASQLDKASRWPVWSTLLLYRKILDAIEDNDYDNLTKRAYVGRTKKLLILPLAYTRSHPYEGWLSIKN